MYDITHVRTNEIRVILNKKLYVIPDVRTNNKNITEITT